MTAWTLPPALPLILRCAIGCGLELVKPIIFSANLWSRPYVVVLFASPEELLTKYFDAKKFGQVTLDFFEMNCPLPSSPSVFLIKNVGWRTRSNKTTSCNLFLKMAQAQYLFFGQQVHLQHVQREFIANIHLLLRREHMIILTEIA